MFLYCYGIDFYLKFESVYLNVWLIKIDLVDFILVLFIYFNVYIGFCIVFKYKNKMWYESF